MLIMRGSYQFIIINLFKCMDNLMFKLFNTDTMKRNHTFLNKVPCNGWIWYTLLSYVIHFQPGSHLITCGDTPVNGNAFKSQLNIENGHLSSSLIPDGMCVFYILVYIYGVHKHTRCLLSETVVSCRTNQCPYIAAALCNYNGE